MLTVNLSSRLHILLTQVLTYVFAYRESPTFLFVPVKNLSTYFTCCLNKPCLPGIKAIKPSLCTAYLVMVGELVRLRDPWQLYRRGLAPSRFNHVGQVETK